MTIHPPLILASASPRRHQLFKLFQIPFSIYTANIDETPNAQETPPQLVCRLSKQKAQAIANQHPYAIVIGADTIVVLDNQILGKPATPAQAKKMLTNLKGKNHYVYSAITLVQKQNNQQYTALSKTTVTMRPYTLTEIDHYIASGDPMDKAGAYAIQNPKFAPVAHRNGCYAGVMGLPLGLLAEQLSKFGIIVNSIAEKCSYSTQQACCLGDS